MQLLQVLYPLILISLNIVLPFPQYSFPYSTHAVEMANPRNTHIMTTFLRLLDGNRGTVAGWITANTGLSSITLPRAISACTFIC